MCDEIKEEQDALDNQETSDMDINPEIPNHLVTIFDIVGDVVTVTAPDGTIVIVSKHQIYKIITRPNNKRFAQKTTVVSVGMVGRLIPDDKLSSAEFKLILE